MNLQLAIMFISNIDIKVYMYKTQIYIYIE